MNNGEEQNFKFGVKHLAYNAELRNRRERLGLSQKELSTKVGLSAHSITSFETFKKWPSQENAENIATFLGTTKEIMFPEWLKFFKLRKSTVDTQYEISERLLPDIVNRFSLPAPSTEEIYTKEELSTEINKVLETLTPREKEVIEMRFGINSPDFRAEKPSSTQNGAMTLEEVSKYFGVGKERIRQIEAKALRKLKHPSRRKGLRDFVYD